MTSMVPSDLTLDSVARTGPVPFPEESGPLGTVGLLKAEMTAHPIWDCRLLRACRLGHLTRADWQFVFSQYYLYSANFTRFLAAAMAGCPNDYYRSQLALNLWEEGGKARPEDRHAEIFREFLREGLGVAPESIEYEAFSEHFVQQYLNNCYSASCASVGAFLALGTETTVPRLYGIFRDGLTGAGLAEQQLRFFTLHIDCDDDHAATLLDMMLSFSGDPGWEQQVGQGMRCALGLRLAFFDNLFEAIGRRRLQALVDGIQDRKPLGPSHPSQQDALFVRGSRGPLLYENVVERLNVAFAVERVPFDAEVLDARLVYIPPGRCNERHKHAHESLFFVLAGEGRVQVGDSSLAVRVGDMVFVPRWVLHQSENLGNQHMVLLAITDYGLTGKAFIGDYHRTARLKAAGEVGPGGLTDSPES
jgi:quercetin dioxygenase-like cupin family protein/pyrroloquinoline quinone (PQQ) biosynthesis protein C